MQLQKKSTGTTGNISRIHPGPLEMRDPTLELKENKEPICWRALLMKRESINYFHPEPSRFLSERTNVRNKRQLWQAYSTGHSRLCNHLASAKTMLSRYKLTHFHEIQSNPQGLGCVLQTILYQLYVHVFRLLPFHSGGVFPSRSQSATI